jgi:hypothetical protein
MVGAAAIALKPTAQVNLIVTIMEHARETYLLTRFPFALIATKVGWGLVVKIHAFMATKDQQSALVTAPRHPQHLSLVIPVYVYATLAFKVSLVILNALVMVAVDVNLVTPACIALNMIADLAIVRTLLVCAFGIKILVIRLRRVYAETSVLVSIQPLVVPWQTIQLLLPLCQHAGPWILMWRSLRFGSLI